VVRSEATVVADPDPALVLKSPEVGKEVVVVGAEAADVGGKVVGDP
jgi:hypothetical protein